MIQRLAYVLDKVGNRTKLTLNGGDYVEYSYNPLYQLTQEHRKASGGSTQYRNDFYYDYISNRTKLVYNDGSSDTTTTYLHNAADQLTKSTTGGTDTTYSYSANGNLTRESSGGSNEDYLYDARNLITKFDGPGTSNDTTYAWDLQARRVKKDINGTVTRFLYDDSVGEILAEYDGSATPAIQATYVPTGLDSNVSMTRSGEVYYFHPDGLQSTWNLTLGTDETVKNTYAYQAFGSQYGTPTENATNTRRFTGAEWNSEDSTQTHGLRRYLPTLGRWNRPDPLLDIESWNLYHYLRSNPTAGIDAIGTIKGSDSYATCGDCGHHWMTVDLIAYHAYGSSTNASSEVAGANSILQQCCIKAKLVGEVEWDKQFTEQRLGSDLILDHNPKDMPMFLDEKRLTKDHELPDTIHVFFVQLLEPRRKGKSYLFGLQKAPYAPSIAIGNGPFGNTLAHEMVHVLSDSTFHYTKLDDRDKLMFWIQNMKLTGKVLPPMDCDAIREMGHKLGLLKDE